jgi:hypothetical protein
MASLGSPGGHFGGQSDKKEVAMVATWDPPRRCSMKKTNEYLQKSPIGFGGFFGIFEIALVCIIW